MEQNPILRMKHFYGFFILICCFLHATPQSPISEFGIFGGISYYLGDINMSKHFYQVRPAANIFYRHNLDDYYSIKAAVSYARLNASDNDSDWPYQQFRKRSLSASVIDFSFVAAFNFLPYKPGNVRRNYWCPYILTGVSYAFIINSFTIPMGVGGKYNISKHWSVGGEWIYCKILSDQIDIKNTYNAAGQQISNPKNRDWMGMLWITISYNIDLLTNCRAYD